jgi:hypothetical protein
MKWNLHNIAQCENQKRYRVVTFDTIARFLWQSLLAARCSLLAVTIRILDENSAMNVKDSEKLPRPTFRKDWEDWTSTTPFDKFRCCKHIGACNSPSSLRWYFSSVTVLKYFRCKAGSFTGNTRDTYTCISRWDICRSYNRSSIDHSFVRPEIVQYMSHLSNRISWIRETVVDPTVNQFSLP